MLEKLKDWVELNKLDCEFKPDNIVNVKGVGNFLLLQEKQKTEITKDSVVYEDKQDSEEFGFIIDKNEYCLILSDKEYELAGDVDYLLFLFGTKFYYSDTISDPKLIEFKYLGKAKTLMTQQDYPFIGIHGGYDLCNGSRTYSDWIKKSKFLGISTLGISEENTLAGVIAFQDACKKHKLRSIVGESVRVQNPQGKIYTIKLYCENKEDGWRNLLEINTYINVWSKGVILEEDLFKFTKGLICILTSHISLEHTFKKYSEHFSKLYFQFDLTEWDSQEKDEEWCLNTQEYLTHYLDILPPVLVNDAYYLDKQDSHIRRSLGIIGHSNFRNHSDTLFFKSIDDYFEESLDMFRDDEWTSTFLEYCIENTIEVFKDIDFQVITGKFYLPQYQMTEEESKLYKSNEDLLWNYIGQGWNKVIGHTTIDLDEYSSRVDKEFDVIKRGGFVDYFLILADIYRFCRENDIWYGVGRGSAAGCLIAYLCDITLIDPLKYGLLFERFLNEGRIGNSLPDIDSDFQGERREEVKRYIEFKYGKDYVMSIGTYGTFKLKNSFKDLTRVEGFDSSVTNYVTAFFPEPQQQQTQAYWEIFKSASKFKPIYDFIQKNSTTIEKIPLLLNQPKNSSIHAAGMVIVPKEYGTVYQQLPVKDQDGQLVSEWEGYYIDEAGFLKMDILGIKQLDKFAAINKLISSQVGKDVRFKDINLDDQEVYQLFREGYNEDVFQFGAAGLKAYCKELQPDDIEDLIAVVAVYRPGPIESGTHKKYIKRKNGYESAESDPGCEDITSNTFGLIVYQEQTIQICQHLGGFSLVEGDDVRRALGKMKREVIEPYKDLFLERSTAKGYTLSSMQELWDKMEAFALYAFNRSHAACYAITGYYSQWYKVHYPLQFWTVSLQYADEKDKESRVSEIRNTSEIEVSPVDINLSDLTFKGDVETNSIYWALPSVKWVGDKVVESILSERSTNGQFFSLEEFYERMKKYSGINVRAISHLIISGAFDKVEKVKLITDRYNLIEKFYKFIGREKEGVEKYSELKAWSEYQWTLKQKELTGFGVFNFKKIVHQSSLVGKINKYQENNLLLVSEDLNKEVLVCGLVTQVIERNSKKGKFGQLEVRDNTDVIYVTLWNEAWEPVKEQLKTINKIVVLSGNIEYDNYKNQNAIRSTNQTKVIIYE